MNPKKRFLIGGGGALMPVLVSFLAIDIAAAIDSDANLSTGNIVGFGVRYLILFLIGGVVAYLHEDEVKPFKLFELGIAAPALITSFITAQGLSAGLGPSPSAEEVAAARQPLEISLISEAHAEAGSELRLAQGGFFSDVIRGLGGGVYRDIAQQQKTVDSPPAQAETRVQKQPQVDEHRAQDPAPVQDGPVIEETRTD